MQETCHVCGESLFEDSAAFCNCCGREFHMALTIDSKVTDCGAVWIDDELLALQFLCNACMTDYGIAPPLQVY